MHKTPRPIFPGLRGRGLLLLAALFLSGCAHSNTHNVESGRDQYITISEADELELGRTAYQEMLATSMVSSDASEVDPVVRVGKRLAEFSGRKDYPWEFHVLTDDKTANAWALPGGKTAVYTGLYPVLKDEAGLAFVMGHEISHALARHTAERISHANAGGPVRGLVRGIVFRVPVVSGVVGTALGVVSGFPFSRMQESEADRLGLMLMAKAGYDPRSGPEVWRRMEAAGGSQPPEFLSTHPSHETRIHDLEAHMAEAVELFKKASPAEVRPLPAIQGSRHTSPKNVPSLMPRLPDGDVKATPLSVRRAKPGPLAPPELHFSLRLDRDVAVSTVEINGPGGIHEKLPGGGGVLGGEELDFRLRAARRLSPEFPAGVYTVRIRGAATGKAFQTAAVFTVSP